MGEPSAGDRDLVARCVRGDARAWEDLVARTADLVASRVQAAYRRVLGRPARPEEVQDAVQDVYLRLAAGGARPLRNFAWRSKLSTYIASVAGTAALDRLRRDAAERRERGADLEAVLAARTAEGTTQPPDAERVRELREALAGLDPRDRLLLEMHFWGGLSLPRAARALGISDRYARVLLEKALDLLRRKIPEK